MNSKKTSFLPYLFEQYTKHLQVCFFKVEAISGLQNLKHHGLTPINIDRFLWHQIHLYPPALLSRKTIYRDPLKVK